jgi:hypothetical protein
MFSFNASAAGEPSPAALLEFARVNNTLVFTVVSTGCTRKEHFSLEISETNELPSISSSANTSQVALNVTLIRIKKDRCRRMPGPKVIEFELPEEQQHSGPIFINNPFITMRPRIRK